MTQSHTSTSLAGQESELRRQAEDYIERASRWAAKGSSVGTREWLEAAETALRVAAHLRSMRLQK